MSPEAFPKLVDRTVGACQRHTRLQALRLVAAVDGLTDRFPDHVSDAATEGAVGAFGKLPGALLGELLAEPAWEDWISRARGVLSSRATDSCPRHHVPRALARFSTLLVSLGHHRQMPAQEGVAPMMGAGSVPVFGSAAQLRPPGARRMNVRWLWDGRLRLFDEGGGAMFALEPGGQGTVELAEGWRVEYGVLHDGVLMFNQPRCVGHPGADEEEGFFSAYQRAWSGLSDLGRSLMRRAVQAVGPACERHPLRAPRFLALPPRPSTADLALSLARSLLSRFDDVIEFQSGRLVETGEGAASPPRDDLLAEEILRGAPTAADAPHLDQLLTRVEDGRQPSAPAPRPGASVPLDFRPHLEAAGIVLDDPDRGVQPRGSDLAKAPDWVLLDLLLTLSGDEVARLREALREEDRLHVRSFGLACLAYHDGEFAAAARHLTTCLEDRDNCEEYWLLLAFTLRHLRRFREFEQIVFEGARSLSLLPSEAEWR